MGQLLVLAQFAILGLFVLFHGLVGAKRGFYKTTYYLIAHIIAVVLLFVGLHFFSISIFIAPTQLFELIDQQIGIPDDIWVYLNDPELLPVIVAIIDLVLKIILFIVGYYFLRFILVFIVFGIIWQIIKPRKYDVDEVGNKIKKPKNRIAGFSMGALRGIFSGLVYLYPILMLINMVTLISPDVLGASGAMQTSSNPQVLEASIPGLPDINLGGYSIEDIFGEIHEFNKNSIYTYMNKINVNGNGLADAAIDFALESKIKESESSIIITKELRGMITVADTVIKFGILDEDFDYRNIDQNKFTELKPIFEYLSTSDLVKIALDKGVVIGVNSAFSDQDLVTDADKQAIITKLQSLGISDDIMTLYDIAYEILAIGNVGKLEEIAADPYQILGLDENGQKGLTNFLKTAGEFKLLEALNVGVMIAIKQDNVLSQITWIENDEDKIEYLEEKLSFILNDDKYIGNQLKKFATLIDVIYEYENDNETSVVDLFSNPNAANLLTEVDKAWASSFIDALINQLDIIFDASPILLDVLYAQDNDVYIHELISVLKENTENSEEDDYLKTEFRNIFGIYEGLLDVGFDKSLLEGELNPILLLDFMGKNEKLAPFFTNHVYTSNLLQAYADKVVSELMSGITDDESLQAALIKAAGIIDANPEKRQMDEVKAFIDLLQAFYSASEDHSLEGFDADSIQTVILSIDIEDAKTFINTSEYAYILIDHVIRSMDQFTIPDVAIVKSGIYENSIARQEIVKLLDVFNALQLTSFDEEAIKNVTIEAIEDALSKESVILDGFIISMLKEQLNKEPFSLNLHDDDFEEGEILKIVRAAKAMGITNFEAIEINPETLTIAQVTDAIDIGSIVINRVVAQKIAEQLNVDIPEEKVNLAYYTVHRGETLLHPELSQSEMNKMVQILGDLDDPEEPKQLTELTEFEVDSFDIDQMITVVGRESIIIHALISQQIKDNETVKVPLRAYENNDPANQIKQNEILGLLHSVKAGGIETINDVSKDLIETLTTDKVKMMLDKSFRTNPSTLESAILKATISDQIINMSSIKDPEAVLIINVNALDASEENEIIKSEIILLIEAIEALEVTTFNNIEASINEEVHIDDVIEMLDTQSKIIKSTISKQIIDNSNRSGKPDAALIIIDDAMDANDEVSKPEIDLLFESIEIIGVTNIATVTEEVNDEIEIAKVRSMLATGSKIIKSTISKQIIDNSNRSGKPDAALIIIDDAMDANDEVSKPEIDLLFESIEIIGVTNIATVTEKVNDEIEITDVEDMLETGSIIIKSTISKQIVDNSNRVPENSDAALIIPDDAMDMNNEISLSEMENLFSSLKEAGVTQIAKTQSEINDTISATTVKNMLSVNSKIMTSTIGKQVKDNSSIIKPKRAFRNNDRNDEIRNAELISAMDGLIAGGIDNIGGLTSEVVDSITMEKLIAMIDVNSAIINATLSNQILQVSNLTNAMNTLIVPVDALDSTYEEIELAYIEINEVETMNLFIALKDGGIAKIDDLNTFSERITLGNTRAMLFVDVEAPESGTVSKIMHATISSEIIKVYTSFTSVPDVAYLYEVVSEYLKATEINSMLNAIKTMDTSGNVDDHILINSFTPGSTPTVGASILKALLDEESSLLDRMISKAAIDSNLATPHSMADGSQEDVKREELVNLANAMTYLGIESIEEFIDQLSINTIKGLEDEEFDEIIDVYKEDNVTFNERYEGLTIISEQIFTVFEANGYNFEDDATAKEDLQSAFNLLKLFP